VLAVGVVATVATTQPALHECPSSSPGVVVSGFYGDQGLAHGRSSWQLEDTVRRTGPFTVRAVWAEIDSCVAANATDGTTQVTITVVVDYDAASDLAPLARAMLIHAGDGRRWKPTASEIDDSWGPGVRVTFWLPLDIAEPVVLQLPAADGDAADDRPDPIPLRTYKVFEKKP